MAEISDSASQHLVFLEHLRELEDPRQLKKATYPLEEILLLVLCAVLSGADDWVAIALFRQAKSEIFAPFPGL